ncbi:MAG TPA: acetate/propionate family kinase [Ktedonobacterales bacterium]|nr:acetate/propionate family kinase [Ktedonobacterales bacterium]
MTDQHTRRILTINTGSSSIKAALYDLDGEERLTIAAQVERIGLSHSRIRITDADGKTLLDEQRDLPDHPAGLQALFAWLQQQQLTAALDAIGHRVVYGGSRYSVPHLIDDDLIQALKAMVPIDPDHLPQAISAIEVAQKAYPSTPQVACFDTAFHRSMPRVAQIYALPRQLADEGVLRYGFHGLSYEYILRALRAEDPIAAAGRVIVAHLGNGASMAAMWQGASVETTMGFSPTGGLVMGTRSGDLDPGALLYLLQARGMDGATLNQIVNHQAGLLGVSGTSADMRDLLDREATDPRAAEAIALFCYQARKFVGALAAVLGGVETLIFTGGIGERAAPIRSRICAGLEFLGVTIDAQRNDAHAPIISLERARVVVRVMKTNEDLMIARHTYRLLS